MSHYVIFGGNGFIGTHLAEALLRDNLQNQLTLVDIRPPRNVSYAEELQKALLNGRAKYLMHDIRYPISEAEIGRADTVVDLAAVHREPGHLPHEYFETNIYGAENVCAYATAVQAKSMVFTSSISVYGATEQPKAEDSLPVPDSAYGSSKLVAEQIHRAWQSVAQDRRLLVLRPGVVFGPGEGGNVTRLVRSLVSGYFVYMGNRKTRKAGGYVKELCEVILFGMNYQVRSEEPFTVLNFTLAPATAMESFVDTILDVAKIARKPLSVPRTLLLGLSYPIHAIATALRINQPISPTRIRKLFRSTNIEAKRLQSLGYTYRYSLKSSFEDWKRLVPSDFSADRKNMASSEDELARSSSELHKGSATINV